MNIVILLALGALVGGVGNFFFKSVNRGEYLLNIVVGIAGVTLGLVLFSGIKGAILINQNSLSLSSVTVAIVSSVLFVSGFRLIRTYSA